MKRAKCYWCVVAVTAGITLFAGALAGGETAKPVFPALRAAIARGQVERTAVAGFRLGKNPFEELPDEGALLVGFDVALSKFVNSETVCALRPVYLTADGQASYGEHGSFSNQPASGKKGQKTRVTRTVQLRAPAGFAVAGVTIRTGLHINGLSLIYMRINGATLDPSQPYASEWVGDQTGGTETTISGEGAPVVGVCGNQDDARVTALGLIYVGTQPAGGLSAGTAQRIRKSRSSQPGQPAEKEPPWKQLELPESAQAPPPRPAEEPPSRTPREPYRDTEHHFSFDIPHDWARMSRTELSKIDELLKQRGLSNQVHYETGFRPLGTRLGQYPYILLQVQPLRTTGLSYEEIQRTLNLGLDGPIKTVQGAFSDIVRGAPTGTAVLDRGRDRIMVRMQMDMAFLGKIEGLSVCHLGSEAIVSLHAYATQNTFANYLSVFNDLDTSFEFDDGYRFVPAKEKEATASLLPILTFMGVAVPLGAVFLVVGARKRRSGAVPS
jgi:hypothetical protein